MPSFLGTSETDRREFLLTNLERESVQRIRVRHRRIKPRRMRMDPVSDRNEPIREFSGLQFRVRARVRFSFSLSA